MQNEVESLRKNSSAELVQLAIDFKNIIDFDVRQMIEDVAEAYGKNIDWSNTQDIIEWLDTEISNYEKQENDIS